MAVLNITPDSFSDGGRLFDGGLRLDRVLRHAEQALEDGAAILDVGGESTRPGADPVGVEQEAERVLPVVEALVRRFDCIVSVDTSTPLVIREAATMGAGMINDVRALQREGALVAAAETGLPVCLMHMQGEPDSMQDNPCYQFSIAEEVGAFLQRRVAACEAVGIGRQQILLDPGFGFGKTLAHNLALFRELPALVELGLPLLVGVSRKSMIGALTGRAIDQRLAGSLALAALAVERGAAIIRAHDVRETVDALAVTAALMTESEN